MIDERTGQHVSEASLSYRCYKQHALTPDRENNSNHAVQLAICPRCKYVSYCPECDSCYRWQSGACTLSTPEEHRKEMLAFRKSMLYTVLDDFEAF
jgi:hypothetical protein